MDHPRAAFERGAEHDLSLRAIAAEHAEPERRGERVAVTDEGAAIGDPRELDLGRVREGVEERAPRVRSERADRRPCVRGDGRERVRGRVGRDDPGDELAHRRCSGALLSPRCVEHRLGHVPERARGSIAHDGRPIASSRAQR